MEIVLHREDFASGTAAADHLVAVTTHLLDQIRHDPNTDVELAAALQVYRNAAYLFRKLARPGSEVDAEMPGVCQTLIDQGNDHFDRFVRGIQPGRPSGSG
jgi:hypothetical protein